MDYKNGKIYTIRSHQTDQFYIGSTCSPLSKRLYEHKNSYKCYLNGKSYFITSFEIVKYDDVYIELLEEYPCENKMMLRKREGELIRDNTCVNKYIAGRNQKEYKEQNKYKINEYIQKYREENKEQINEYRKKYRELNKEQINEYREKNKEKIKECQKKQITCKCGSTFCINSKSQHQQSKKHLNFVNNNHDIII
jgi:hypothetical protein